MGKNASLVPAVIATWVATVSAVAWVPLSVLTWPGWWPVLGLLLGAVLFGLRRASWQTGRTRLIPLLVAMTCLPLSVLATAAQMQQRTDDELQQLVVAGAALQVVAEVNQAAQLTSTQHGWSAQQQQTTATILQAHLLHPASVGVPSTASGNSSLVGATVRLRGPAPEISTRAALNVDASTVLVASAATSLPQGHSSGETNGPHQAVGWHRGDRITATVRLSSMPRTAQQQFLAQIVDSSSVEVTKGHDPVSRIHTKFREVLVAAAQTPTHRDAAALVSGMVSGDDSLLQPQTRTAMQQAGLSHLTAVSGANLAIVAGFLLGIATVLGASRSMQLLMVAIGLSSYVIFVGPEPSVLRAAAMAGIALAGLFLGGGTALVGLQLAMVGLLLANPWLSWSVGFQLSCAATAGLLLITPTLLPAKPGVSAGWLARLGTAIQLAVAVSVSAWLATAVIIVGFGDGISAWAILANVLVAPLVAGITISGLIVAGLSVVVPVWAATLAQAPMLGAQVILSVAQSTQNLGQRLLVPEGHWGAVSMLLLIIGVALVYRHDPRIVRIGVTVAAAVGLVTAQLPKQASWPNSWQVGFCDVGQGDATLIRLSVDAAMLIDTGGDQHRLRRCLDAAGVRTIPILLLSHFHADHVGAADYVITRFEPQQVWVSALAEPAENAYAVQQAAQQSVVPLTVATIGARGQAGWASWQVLDATTSEATAEPNAASVPVRVVQGSGDDEISVLLPGDLTAGGQAMLAAAPSVSVDIVKVPHHGSKDLTPQLAARATADLAVFSVGADNDYGHPSQLALDTWASTQATIARTDQQGDVVVWRDHGRLMLSTSSHK